MKSLSLLIIFTSIKLLLYAQFSVVYDKQTGAVTSIINTADKYKMNWVFSSKDAVPSWQKDGQNWGLGKFVISGQQYKWQKPLSIKINKNESDITYRTGQLEVIVQRHYTAGFFTETYTVKNIAASSLKVDSFGIYTPFNDNYPDAKTCATNRCNMHVWAGLNSSYVNAVRMGGKAPHLGLVLSKGAIESYSIENRGLDGGGEYVLSNVRGTTVLNMPSFILKSNECYIIQWKLFWHKGWKDFFSIAKSQGFVKVSAPQYVIQKGRLLSATVDAANTTKLSSNIIPLPTGTLGEHTIKIPYANNRVTTISYLVISSPESIIANRIHFIVNNQQMNNSADARYGAYMLFDNETKKIVTDIENLISPPDKDEGAERLGMGVFIAKWLQHHHDTVIYQSLLRYVLFVKEKLQDSNYKVYSTVSHTSRHRAYNYPWVADLYLQMYHLTKRTTYLKDYYYTLLKFYKEFGYQFYAIGIPLKDGIKSLQAEGFKAEANVLLNEFRQMGGHFLQNGIDYPKSEVNYEQSIVAPSILFLLELYLVTKDKKYLDGAKLQLPSLESFNGKQPDVHLNEIAIRHWDGYWFGKKQTWGDVMPHHWSMLTANAYQQYYEITRNKSYRNKAILIAQNNLLNFKENGVASCAFIYPATVNGKQGKFYDAYANDQDWALRFYLNILPSK